MSVLLLHGEKDPIVRYEGGLNLGSQYPGAQETARRYAAHAGCDPDDPVPLPRVDVESDVAGTETAAFEYAECAPGESVALWTFQGAAHIPKVWTPEAIDRMVGWIIDHPRKRPECATCEINGNYRF